MELEKVVPKKDQCLSVIVEDLIISLLLPVSGVGVDEGTDLAQSPMWSVDLSWSEQAKALRMVAIQNPQTFSVDYAKKSISQLRIVGREVVYVDEGTLLFSNLEELVLTGNLITLLSTAYLPAEIKVLELCYNKLSGLPCVNGHVLSQLEHLGLAYNNLTQLELTPSHWPRLLSLDLSHNCLCDLRGTVSTLHSLLCLRSLMLTGNPLTFVLHYKDYVVDGLRQLICLDGNDISSNIREEAKGAVALCEHQPELITLCKLKFSVPELSGLPQLHNIEESSDQEGVIVQYMLTVGHEFLQREAYSPMSELTDNAKEILKHIHDDTYSSCQPIVFFEPTKYKTDSSVCSSMARSFSITDLSALVNLLNQGMNIRVGVNKLVYGKSDQLKEDSPSVARKQLTSAKGIKSGRTSTQSGVSSTTKKTVVANTKPAKGKMSQDQEKRLLEDGWKILNTTSYKLGAKSLNISSLLEDKRTLTVSGSLDLSEADRSKLSQSGLLNTATEDCDNTVENDAFNNIEVSLVLTINIGQT